MSGFGSEINDAQAPSAQTQNVNRTIMCNDTHTAPGSRRTRKLLAWDCGRLATREELQIRISLTKMLSRKTSSAKFTSIDHNEAVRFSDVRLHETLWIISDSLLHTIFLPMMLNWAWRRKNSLELITNRIWKKNKCGIYTHFGSDAIDRQNHGAKCEYNERIHHGIRFKWRLFEFWATNTLRIIQILFSLRAERAMMWRFGGRKWKCASPITNFDCDRDQIRKQMVIARPKNEKLVPRSVCACVPDSYAIINFNQIQIYFGRLGLRDTRFYNLNWLICTSSRSLQSLKSKMSLMRAHYVWQAAAHGKQTHFAKKCEWLSLASPHGDGMPLRCLKRCT